MWLWPPCVYTDTIRIYEVWTLSLHLLSGHFHLYITTQDSRHYPRPRVLHLLSSIPNEAMRVFYVFSATVGVEPTHLSSLSKSLYRCLPLRGWVGDVTPSMFVLRVPRLSGQ